MDQKSITLYASSFIIGALGMATLNAVAIVAGILAALSTVAYNVIKLVKELKSK